MITRDQILHAAPAAAAHVDLYLPALATAMTRFAIATPRQQAHFTAQVLHETQALSCLVESLNYSAVALRAQWPSHFTLDQAQQYGRTTEHAADQRMIANLAYGSRMGNGPIHSDDGYNYRGRGGLQITGLDMYRRCGTALGIDLVSAPQLLEKPTAAMLAAGWVWDSGNSLGHSLNALAEAGEVDAITRAINGGRIGLAERAQLTRKLLEVV